MATTKTAKSKTTAKCKGKNSSAKHLSIKKPSTNKKGKKLQSSSPLRHFTSYMLWITLGIVGIILLYFIGRLVVDNAFVIRAKFGKIIYPDGEVRGIDISHYQDEIDWDRLRNAELGGVPIRFIFIKATEGVDIIDENFNHNFYHARNNGFMRGAYHFFSTKSDPVRQAKHYCKIVQLDSTDIVPILDVERREGLTPAKLRTNVIRWMDYVENYYHAIPILYTSYSFRKDYLNTPEFDRYPFWIAHYYVDHLQYKGKWAFWQHSDRGRVDGIKGDVDVNVFNGNYEQFLQLMVGSEE